ncbi:hypothetical protein ABB37_00792 [Leptomonas pyrrhocoris]|uniref:Uncharacterized protein n=1 Tax=Leptomonas pyrrhocoris TaxID=157538 RepID=A0A0M9GB62_LEPPY|nr:hypothetical protein ABB37_00792 [Leptomonas pyrrhocoris]KPA86697.1 hypothetical protein ABB37_00792 [Leptomonas pyrrhocoris]|eukprot:XP_015665136.1 hypothetical protein ABB37_00792 [Leptomonas pyrrhocoris]
MRFVSHQHRKPTTNIAVLMDVSQFLKSFKKNVAAKGKRVSAVGPSAGVTDATEAEELSELLHSDSDHETEGPSADYVVGGRADRINGKRYAAHEKHNQEFEALKVFSTNVSRADEPGRLQRQRAAVAQQLKTSQKRPRAELVASVRGELLRQREQLQRARASASAEVAGETPVAQVEATMVQVEDLLLSQSADKAAIGPPTATLLDFLPPARAPAVTLVAASSSGPPETTVGPSFPVAESAMVAAASGVSAAPSSLPRSTTGAQAKATETPAPAKKRSKFELAMAMAKADENE